MAEPIIQTAAAGVFLVTLATAIAGPLAGPYVVIAMGGASGVRRWVDLDREDVATSVAYIGSKVLEVTPELQATILAKPVAVHENLALRKLFFS